MDQQSSTGMSGSMIGYVLLDSGHASDDSQYLVGFRITSKVRKFSYIVPIQNSQCFPLEKKMKWQSKFYACLNRLEVEPPFAIYLDKIRLLELAKVRESQTDVAAEQERIEHMTQLPIVYFHVLQLPEFILTNLLPFVS